MYSAPAPDPGEHLRQSRRAYFAFRLPSGILLALTLLLDAAQNCAFIAKLIQAAERIANKQPCRIHYNLAGRVECHVCAVHGAGRGTFEVDAFIVIPAAVAGA